VDSGQSCRVKKIRHRNAAFLWKKLFRKLSKRVAEREEKGDTLLVMKDKPTPLLKFLSLPEGEADQHFFYGGESDDGETLFFEIPQQDAYRFNGRVFFLLRGNSLILSVISEDWREDSESDFPSPGAAMDFAFRACDERENFGDGDWWDEFFSDFSPLGNGAWTQPEKGVGHFSDFPPPASAPEVNGWTKERFTEYLRETLIPDLEESGSEATAEDFRTALGFLEL
jgi:hypothetical protein